MTPRASRRSGERGSALLIVFVFAAIIAIYLYREFPVSVFEAKRQKEQLLVDRGHEYVRAIQLFYRRNRGQFPASISQLENTNNIRYLRKKYKDPFTGKDDWRLLHAGPGGILVDSKANPSGLGGLPGQPGAAPAPFGNSSSTGAPQNVLSSDSSTSSSGDGVVVQPVVQRGPAVSAGGEGSPAAGAPPTTAQLDQNPDQPIVPTAAAVAAATNGAAAGAAAASGAANAAGGPGGTLSAQAPGAPNSQAPGIMQQMQPILGSPTNAGGVGGPQAGINSGGSLGRLTGGGSLAGVASIAKGRSILRVEEQSDYSLWEFHYDPSKDTSLSGGANPAGALQNGQVAPAGAFANQNTNQQGVLGQSNNQPSADPNATSSDQANPAAPNSPNPNQPNPNQTNRNQLNPAQPFQAQPAPQ
jgi:hypothetical protein